MTYVEQKILEERIEKLEKQAEETNKLLLKIDRILTDSHFPSIYQ